MRVSPQCLVILATSGLLGWAAMPAAASGEFEVTTTSANASQENTSQELSSGESSRVTHEPTPETGAAALELSNGQAVDSAAIAAELQAAIDGYQPASASHGTSSTDSGDTGSGEPNSAELAAPHVDDSAAAAIAYPAAAEAHNPAPTVKADPIQLGQGPRQITPEEAERIIEGAVERRNQPQGQPATDTPEPDPDVDPALDGPEAVDADEPDDEPVVEEEPEEPRVLVAEVLVAPSQGELDPELENLVYNVVETRPGRTTTRTQLQQDINNVFATGFFADVDVVPEDTDLGVRVTFVVQPNPVLTDVRVVGNEVLPEAEVDRIFADQKGEIINLIDFQEGIVELNEWYQRNGYVLAQVIAAPRVSDQGVVTLEVAEGVIESIQVRFVNEEGQTVDEEGNPVQGRTRDFIITREFQTQPGDVFNQAQIERDFGRVFGLQIFDDVSPGLEPSQEDPRKVNVIVNVTERNTGSVAAGLGFNFTGDIFGTVSFRQDNFGGNNQKFTAEAQLSTRDLLFDISFTDPWIAGDPFRTSYTANAFARRAINLNFDGGPNPINLENGDRVRVRRIGSGITFSRPLANGWTVAVGTQFQNVSSRDADGNVNATDAQGNPLTVSGTGVDDLWTVPISASLDRRNDPFNPTSGSILRLNAEQSIPLGRGSIFMNRLRGSYSHYIPLSLLNIAEGPQALAMNVQVGTILGDVPPYEAFALGGTNSIRGYDEGEVGGGRSYAQFTAEYRFPVFAFLGGALFVDAGTDLGSGNAVPGSPGPSRGKPGSGFGYGAGVRIQTPLGPLRIDYGFGDQGQGRLHFGIGERF